MSTSLALTTSVASLSGAQLEVLTNQILGLSPGSTIDFIGLGYNTDQIEQIIFNTGYWINPDQLELLRQIICQNIGHGGVSVNNEIIWQFYQIILNNVSPESLNNVLKALINPNPAWVEHSFNQSLVGCVDKLDWNQNPSSYSFPLYLYPMMGVLFPLVYYLAKAFF